MTSVDCEGQRKGFDLALISEIRRRVSVPVIAGGGAGSADHVIDLATQAHADAVCCASIFHYGTCPLPQLKQSLSDSGIQVRS